MRVFIKDNVKYLFSSKIAAFNNPYAVSDFDRKDIDSKIEKTLNFYKGSYISVNGEKQISLFDFSTAANIQPTRYHAELYNRISTMRIFAKELGFDAPIFLTLTAPSYLKPLKQVKLGKSKNVKLVDNPKFSGEADYISKARDFISDSWRKFLRQQIFKDIKAEFNQNIVYLRVFEPHLDGCPHCHIVAFIPSKFKDRFVKLAKSYFSTRTDIKSEFDDDAGGVVSYLLKYVLKTFKNGKNGELNDVAYWYILYGVRRFTTSRTIIPMYLYRKIRQYKEFRDLKYVTNLFRDGFISCDLIADNKKFVSGEKLKASDYIVASIIVSVDGFDYLEHKIAYKRNDNVKIHFYSSDGKIQSHELKSVREAYNSDIKLVSYNPYKIFRTAWKDMSDERLKLYWRDNQNEMTDDILSVQDYAMLENEMIERGFLQRYKNHIRYFTEHALEDIRELEFKYSNNGVMPYPF
mgnify:FL=1